MYTFLGSWQMRSIVLFEGRYAAVGVFETNLLGGIPLLDEIARSDTGTISVRSRTAAP